MHLSGGYQYHEDLLQSRGSKARSVLAVLAINISESASRDAVLQCCPLV